MFAGGTPFQQTFAELREGSRSINDAPVKRASDHSVNTTLDGIRQKNLVGDANLSSFAVGNRSLMTFDDLGCGKQIPNAQTYLDVSPLAEVLRSYSPLSLQNKDNVC